jgi:Holliday junction resolvase RusA-like endonuclease
MEIYFLCMLKTNNGFIAIDSQIANKLGLNIKKYRSILKKFNAVKRSDGDYYFKTQKDAENAKEYLDDNYMIVAKLIE